MTDQKLSEYAPTIAGATVTKAYCDGIVPKTAPEAKPSPELTKVIVQAVIAEFADIEAANGYISIAQKHGVTRSQVKTLHREFLLTKNVPQKVVEPVEEPIEVTK